MVEVEVVEVEAMEAPEAAIRMDARALAVEVEDVVADVVEDVAVD